MNHVIAVLVRVVALGVALAAYYAALPYLFPDDGGGANIGAGLIAFGAIVLVCFVWGLADGRRRDRGTNVLVWVVVGVTFGAAWVVGLTLVEADGSMSLAESLRVDAFLAVYFAGLVAVPGILGATIASPSRPS